MAITFNPRQTTRKTFQRATKPESVEYVGVFRRQVYANHDGFKIIKLEDGTTVKLNDLHNQLTAGLTYRFSGRWKDSRNPQYPGKEFHAEHFTVDKPTTESGVVGYLSKMCEGVGPFYARKIFEKFGDQAVEVVRLYPEKIAEAGILEFKKAQKASDCLQSHNGMEQTRIRLLELLHGQGFGAKSINQCIDKWGVTAPEVIRRDPFKMLVAGIRGAGYTRCDNLYLNLGLPPGRLKRQMLAIWYKLKTNRDGHTWVKLRSLGALSDKVIKYGLRAKWIAQRVDRAGVFWLADWQKAHDEISIANSLKTLLSWQPTHADLSRTLWPSVDEIEGLSDHQRDIIAPLLDETVAILGGKPGTGKTYSVAKIVKSILDIHGPGDVGVCAPTGKAARRVQENLQANGVFITARTIHSMFGLTVYTDDDEEEENAPPLNGDEEEAKKIPRFVIIDEVSMLDANVANRLLSKLPYGTHVLLVGDVNQLPPVGHGSPLRDILNAKAVPCGELTEIRRNSGLIVTACHQIADGMPFSTAGKLNLENGDNLRAVPYINDADTIEGILKDCRLLPGAGFDPVEDTQVIAALNVKGNCSKAKINEVLQSALNVTGKKVEGKRFRVRDKVIYTKNMELAGVEVPVTLGGAGGSYDRESPESYFNSGMRYRIANGDIGQVIAIDENATIVQFEAPKRVVRLTRDTECFLDLAYVVSCHKFQGSESPVVIVALDPAAGSVCCREWIYTAISRAKKFCVLVGPRGLAERFCKRVSINNRKTFLAELLKCQPK